MQESWDDRGGWDLEEDPPQWPPVQELWDDQEGLDLQEDPPQWPPLVSDLPFSSTM